MRKKILGGLLTFIALSFGLMIVTLSTMEISASAPTGVTVDTTTNRIYANGSPIIIADVDGDTTTTNDTLIYIDTDSDGVIDSGESAVTLSGLTGSTTIGYDLSTYSIFGGATVYTTSTRVTMLGGAVLNIFGSGSGANHGSDSTIVTINGGTISGRVYGGGNYCLVTNTNVTINGGTIGDLVYGAGYFGSSTNTNVTVNGGTINGNVYGGAREQSVSATNVTINGGTMNYVYGGGSGNSNNVATSTNVTINGGTINNDVYGGCADINIPAVAIVKISVDANISGTISAQGNGPTTGTGSHIEYEVAFYDQSGGTKYDDTSDYPPQWITSGGTATEPATNPTTTELTKAFSSWNKTSDSTVFDFDVGVTAATKLYPTFGNKITTYGASAFANGYPIIITGGTAADFSKIYIDINANGEIDTDEPIAELTGSSVPTGGVDYGYALSTYNIYGGSYTSTVASAKITMLGGEVNMIFGGGCEQLVTGNTSVTIIGGTVNYRVYGGGYNNNVTGVATVKIGVDAAITDEISSQGYNIYTTGAGSHVEYEVAFYPTSGGTKYTTGIYAPQWITSGNNATEPTTEPAPSSTQIFSGWNVVGGSSFAFTTTQITAATKLYPNFTDKITVNTTNKRIYANGSPIIIADVDEDTTTYDDTFIYLDNGTIGTYEAGTDTVVDLG
ncbi:MAG: hypothetical protein WC900_04460, partial [Oscillospiraceae bacterium]